jgi:hypothetical protein
MALFKNFKYPNGTETNYHKIGEIRIVPLPDRVTYIEEPVEIPEVIEATVATVAEGEMPEGEMPEGEMPEAPTTTLVPVYTKYVSVMVQILSYVSQEIRETGVKNNLTGQLQYFSISMDELVSADIMALCYNLVKTLPDFVDAEDII